MVVRPVSASPPSWRIKEKAAANRTFHVRQTTAFGSKNRLRGSRRLSHKAESLVLLGRSGLLVRLLSGVMLLVSSLRSEEHTSELQSRENLVCRLLLEKKK